jgi:NTP pyrophosphatase (non-canonical NTP hydrolase)
MKTPLEYSHEELVAALAKPGEDIVETMNSHNAHLIHMVMGICGEAGELLDAIKKATIYQKELDLVNVVEELGDLEFYIQGLRAALHISREQCLEANIEKLRTRYGKVYSDKAAQERADKQ